MANRQCDDVTWLSWRLESPTNRLFSNLLFNSLLRLTPKKTWQRRTLLAVCKGNPSVTDGFSSQRAGKAENVPCQGIVIGRSGDRKIVRSDRQWPTLPETWFCAVCFELSGHVCWDRAPGKFRLSPCAHWICARWQIHVTYTMMTSSNGNIFCVTGPLCGKVTGHQRILLTKASDAEMWCFLWSAPEQTVE